MINSIEDLRSAGVLPTGPCSAWPESRNRTGPGLASQSTVVAHDTKVQASVGQMAAGLINVAGQALQHGKVSFEIREERMETCRACPHFIEESKRCSQCGCFMEAKTWVAAKPSILCPKNKWKR